MLRFFKEWCGLGWNTESTIQSVLADVQALARADDIAVEWDALRGALWWLDSRTLMANDNTNVDHHG